MLDTKAGQLCLCPAVGTGIPASFAEPLGGVKTDGTSSVARIFRSSAAAMALLVDVPQVFCQYLFTKDKFSVVEVLRQTSPVSTSTSVMAEGGIKAF